MEALSRRANQASIAKYRVAITNLHHLFEAMGNENNTESLRLEVAHNPKELLDLGRREGRSRLIHDDQLRLHREGSRDLDHLLLSNAQFTNDRHRSQLKAEACGDFFRLSRHFSPVYENAGTGFAPDKDVLGDGHVRSQGELLIDGDNAASLRIVWRGHRNVLSGEFDSAAVRLLRTGEDFDKCRLAGSILTEQCVDLARKHFQAGIIERLDARKSLADQGHP
jgi:hypothetical protein